MSKISKNILTISSDKLKQPKFIKNVFIEDNVNLIKVNPRTLLTPNRFDIIAKLIFLNFHKSNSQDNFGKKLYKQHIKLLNGFLETQSNEKQKKIGIENFLLSFRKLLASIKKGFNEKYAIPISSTNSILDGAHRVATSIYLNKDVYIFKVDRKDFNYNYSYFAKKNFPDYYLDAMATEYLKYKDNLRLIFLWPSAGNSNNSDFDQIINQHGDIVYKKSIKINPNNAWVLIREVYKNEKWLGNFNNQFIGAKNKAIWCFENNLPLRVILYESKKDLIKVKENIRKIFNKGKHSVHITDSYSETVELAKLIFNKNSINWINNYRLNKFNWFDNLFKNYQQFLKSSGLNVDKFCIDGSSVMSIYGLREARDLDFIHTYKKKIQTNIPGIAEHNSAVKYHGLVLTELINDPRYFFYYSGLKVISIEQLEQFKSNRNEKKDINDVNFINSVIKNTEFKDSYFTFNFFTKDGLKNFIFLVALKLRFYFYKFIITKKYSDDSK